MFQSLLTNAAGQVTASGALICLFASLLCGLIISLLYMFKSNYTKSFAIGLILLPALVQVVITVVNGNLGAAVSVMGAFSLIRFRSLPGTTKDITFIFFAMAVGLANGMGYVFYSGGTTLVLAVIYLILILTKFGEGSKGEKSLKILIPEALDYTTVFDDTFEKYLSKSELVKVKTTDLGSIFELNYMITVKDPAKEKEFVDELRTKNGNLTIICSRPVTRAPEEM